MNLTKLDIHKVKPLQGFHNKVYRGSHQGNNIVIRVTPVAGRRTYDELEAEIGLLHELKDKIKVGRPYEIKGKSIIEYDGDFLVFFVEEAGRNWHAFEHDASTYETAGKNLAILHNATYESRMHYKRQSFAHHPDIKLLENLAPLYQAAINSVLNEMRAWKKDDREYGLIHGDYLFSNLLYPEHDIVIIDFDDIEYNYYLYDIAVYLFYYLLGGKPDAIDLESNIGLFKAFIKGYHENNRHIVLDMRKIQTLFRLRQLKLLATIKTAIPENEIGPWQRKYLALTHEQIVEHRPFVTIDYETLYTRTIKGLRKK